MLKKAEHRQYPRTVWVLSPAYMVKQVAVVRRASAWSKYEYGDLDAKGKRYKVEAMHETKQGAIDYGRRQIEARREYLAKQSALLDVRSIKLAKAEAK